MNKIYTIGILLSCLLLASCADSFLDLSPESQSNEKTFYKTEGDFDRALSGVYEKLRPTHDWPGFMMGESRSDNTHYTYSSAVSHSIKPEDIVDFIDDSQNPITNNMYLHTYDAIARANTLLGHIQDKSFSESYMNKTIGQTKFLRAYNYFMLVQYFGAVSLHLDQVKNTDDAFLSQSSVEEVYEQIIKDATEAVNKLGVVVFSADKASGRATKGSAHMLLANVLMTKPNRDYVEAEKHLREIINMGYELLPNYADVFNPTYKNSRESLFEVQYQEGNLGQQSNWLYRFMPKTPLGIAVTGVENTNTQTWGGYNVPTQSLIDSYEPADKRINASIAVVVGENRASDNAFIADKVLNVGDPQISTYSVSYYMINKYRHAHAKLNNTDDNWPIYRYSDVLLLLSECLVEQGRSAEAATYVNQVRQRAGLDELTQINADIVAKERRLELAFENHRWADLIRTGKAIEVMTEHGKRMKAIYPYLQERTYQVTNDKLLFPIPYRELQINTELKQNKGY